MQNRFFSLFFFDLPFWRNPNFGNFYWFSMDFILENQVIITKKSGICIGKSRLVGFLRDPIENVLFPLKVIHIGAGLTAFRILPKHLVKEHAVSPQLENLGENRLVKIWQILQSHDWSPLKLNFGAKSMFFWTKIVTVGDILGVG